MCMQLYYNPTTLWKKFNVVLQLCDIIISYKRLSPVIVSITILLQGCYNLSAGLLQPCAQPCNKLVVSLLQPCHKLVVAL